MDAMADCDQTIVVDAMDSGVVLGTCFVEEVAQDSAPTFRSYCRHRQIVNDIVELGRWLAVEGARKRTVFIGVEGGGAHWDESHPDGVLASAVPLAVDSVLRSFGADVALRKMVSCVCPPSEAADGTSGSWQYQGAA
jgi:hypothetical protein